MPFRAEKGAFLALVPERGVFKCVKARSTLVQSKHYSCNVTSKALKTANVNLQGKKKYYLVKIYNLGFYTTLENPAYF